MLGVLGQALKYGRVLKHKKRDRPWGCHRYRVLKRACASLHSWQASAQADAEKLIMITERNLFCEQLLMAQADNGAP